MLRRKKYPPHKDPKPSPQPLRRRWAAAGRIITIGAVIAAGAWLLYFMAVTLVMPYPIEYREGAAQVVTQLLLAGRNPFTPENQPLGMTNYGIMFSLSVWPLAALIGNTLLVHRLITDLFLLLSAYLILHTARASNRELALSLAGAELAAAALATRGGLGGYPSSMGAFLFLASITVPYLRGFDRWGMLGSGAASLLALYTKPYFVLGYGIVASYTFFFVSKKSGLAYALGFAAAAAASVLVVRYTLPLYFHNTVFNNLAQAAQNDPAHLYGQLRQLVIEFLPLVVAGLMIQLSTVGGREAQANRKSPPFSLRELAAPDRPLCPWRMDYFGYAALCTFLAFALILGPHPENYMNYAYQLVVPAFVLWLLVKLQPRRRLTSLVAPLLLINLGLFFLMRLPPSQLQHSPQSEKAWAMLYDYADSCTHPLNSPTVVPEMIKRGLWPVDSGHTEYFFRSRPIPGMRWFGASHELISQLGANYLNALRGSVAHGEFDCIMLARHSGWPRNLPLDRGGYRLADSVVIAMPQTGQTWQMDIWTAPAQ